MSGRLEQVQLMSGARTARALPGSPSLNQDQSSLQLIGQSGKTRELGLMWLRDCVLLAVFAAPRSALWVSVPSRQARQTKDTVSNLNATKSALRLVDAH